MLLYTYATQRPIGTRARSPHVGTPAHVYTVPVARLITAARARSYTTDPLLNFRYVPVATIHPTARFLSIGLPYAHARCEGPSPLRADGLFSCHVAELAVDTPAVSSEPVSAPSNSFHAIPFRAPQLTPVTLLRAATFSHDISLQ